MFDFGLSVPCPSGWMGAGFHLLFYAKPGGKRVEIKTRGEVLPKFCPCFAGRQGQGQGQDKLGRGKWESSKATKRVGLLALSVCARACGLRRPLWGGGRQSEGLLGRTVARASQIGESNLPIVGNVRCHVDQSDPVAEQGLR